MNCMYVHKVYQLKIQNDYSIIDKRLINFDM